MRLLVARADPLYMFVNAKSSCLLTGTVSDTPPPVNQVKSKLAPTFLRLVKAPVDPKTIKKRMPIAMCSFLMSIFLL